jgi:hypothetical protein
MDHSEQARQLRQQIAVRHTQHAYPPDLVAQVRAHVEACRAAGVTMAQISADLGVSLDTLYRWRRDAPGFRQVEVVAEAASSFTVHGPRGLRIEGLDLASLADLLRRLA